MKHALCILLLALVCSTTRANPNFVSNPWLPYPPSCVRAMGAAALDAPDSGAVRFHVSQIELFDAQSGDRVPVTLAAYRSPCAEPGRSLIWLEFRLAKPYITLEVELGLPVFVAESRKDWRYVMNLVTEPGGWGARGHVERERTYLTSEPNGYYAQFVDGDEERRWVFLLDNGPEYLGEVPVSGLTPTEYNGSFTLWLRFPPYDYLSIEVPATSELLAGATAPLPLSGRHAGIWVVEGAANQGVQLSISEQVGKRASAAPGVPDLPLSAFFSLYTFEDSGRPLWLVGNTEFAPGTSEVRVTVLRFSDGGFRSAVPGVPEVVGSITLRSRSCNDLGFEYDFSVLGLGAGSRRLQRLYSLETAGYDCRDYEARTAANR
jgi:hypothetical protein